MHQICITGISGITTNISYLQLLVCFDLTLPVEQEGQVAMSLLAQAQQSLSLCRTSMQQISCEEHELWRAGVHYDLFTIWSFKPSSS